MIRQKIRVFCYLIILPLVLVSGCINYEEEITLNADGSGTLLMHYSLSQQLTAMMQLGEGSTSESQEGPDMPFKLKEDEIKKDLQAEGVTVEKVETKTQDDQQHYYVHVSFKNLTDLNKTKTFQEMPFEWKKEGKTATFTHTLKGKKDAAGGGSEGDAMGDQMAQAMLGNAAFKFRVKLPSKAKPSPDTNGTILEDGKTVTWEFPLTQIGKEDKVMLAKFETGGLPFSPLLMVALGAGALVSVIALVLVIMYARKP